MPTLPPRLEESVKMPFIQVNSAAHKLLWLFLEFSSSRPYRALLTPQNLHVNVYSTLKKTEFHLNEKMTFWYIFCFSLFCFLKKI